MINGTDLGLLLGDWQTTPSCLSIDGCQPSTGGHGTVVTFTGQGFDSDEDDLCVRLMPEGVVAARAVLAEGNTLQATVTAVPTGARR